MQCIAGSPLLCGEQLGGDGGDRAADRQLQPPHPRPGEARHQVCRIHPGNNTDTVCGTTIPGYYRSSLQIKIWKTFSSFKLNQTNRNLENFNRKVSLINHVN